MDHKDHLTIEGIRSEPKKSRVIVVSFGGSVKTSLSSLAFNLAGDPISPDGEDDVPADAERARETNEKADV